MRLIKNKAAAEGIVQYDTKMRDLEFEETFVSAEQGNYINEVLKLWSVKNMYKDAGVHSYANNKDMKSMNNYWLSKNPVDYEHLFNRLAEYNEALVRHGKDFLVAKEKAKELISVLKKEYHID